MRLPELGVGLVFWRASRAPIFDHRAACIDVIEIEPESFWLPTPGAGFRCDADDVAFLQAIDLPKLVHSVALPVGGSVAPSPQGLALLRDVVVALDAPWASTHLSFNQVDRADGREHTGFLLPPLQSDEGVECAARNLRTARDALGVPVAFETGVNYLRPTEGEMADGEFVAALASEADCGILLDVHNIWVNARNGRQSVDAFLAALPLERVWELHVAGGEAYDGYHLDSHSRTAPGAILDLAAEIVPHLRNLKAIVFEILPTFAETVSATDFDAQMRRLRAIWATRGTRAATAPPPRPCAASTLPYRPSHWENALADQLSGAMRTDGLSCTLAADPGIAVYRRLIRDARAGAIIDAARLTSRLILLHAPDVFSRLLAEFMQATKAELFGLGEGIAFLEFIASRRIDIPLIEDVARFEHAQLRTLFDAGQATVAFHGDPLLVVECLSQGIPPPRLATDAEYTLTVARGTVVAARVDAA